MEDLDEGRGAPDPQGFDARLAQYAEWMRVHHYSGETVRARTTHMRAFIAWCADRGLERPSEVTRAILERYQSAVFHHRKRNGLSLSLDTQRIRLGDVRVFFKWLAAQGHLLYNPAKDLVLPRQVERLPRHVLTADEAEKVLAQPDVATAIGLRDRAILETLYSTGIRRIELARLALEDLDAGGGTIRIREGKAKRQRILPIGERAVGWVQRYLAEVRPRYVVEPDQGYLFLSRRGGQLALKEVTRLARTYVVAAGIGKSGSAHLFRHTMATLMLENGADIRFIQVMLGHANLVSTQRYAHVAIGKLKEVHAATHPAAATRHSPTPPPPEAATRAAAPPSSTPPSPKAATPPSAGAAMPPPGPPASS